MAVSVQSLQTGRPSLGLGNVGSNVSEWISRSADETIEIGRQIAASLKAPVLVFLSGDLGAGKTTLSKGIIGGLGAAREEDVTSPTFTLVHVFHNHSAGVGRTCSPQNIKVYHVDLYRIERSADLELLGLEDAVSEPAVLIIEWPDRFSINTEWPKITVELEHL